MNQPRPLKSLLGQALLLSLGVFFLQFCYWMKFIRGFYFPNGDDVALITSSTRFFHPSVAAWFTRGFADYLRPYPDLAIAGHSNYVRPVVNFTYFVNSLLFGRHWSAYLLTNYLIVALIAGVVYVLCRRWLNLPAAVTAIVMVAAVASPSYTFQLAFWSSFAFDYLSALLILLALVWILEGRLALAWVFVLVALFTKESSYYAPLAATVAVYLRYKDGSGVRRLLRALAFLLPMGVVALLRLLSFHTLTGVHYTASPTAKGFVRNIIFGGLHWPYSLSLFKVSVHPSFSTVAALTFSLLVWILFAYIVWTAWATESSAEGAASNSTIVTVFLAGSLLMPILFNLKDRFGASAYPLFFLCLGALALNLKAPQLVRVATVVIIVVGAINGCVALCGQLSTAHLRVQQENWALSRELVDRLARNEHPVTFLFADTAESFTSPPLFERFAGYRGTLVPLSNLDRGTCSTLPTLGVQRSSASDFELTSDVPLDCGYNGLFGAYRLDKIAGTTVERNLADAQATYHAQDRSAQVEEFDCQELDIALHVTAPDYSLLVPDLTHNTFREYTQDTAH